MSETTIAPCPVCGGDGQVLGHANIKRDRWLGQCLDCGFSIALPTWNRLSRAAALLRACEAIEAWHRDNWKGSIDIEVMQDETIGIYAALGVVRGPSLPAALIALAQQIGAPDAE